MAACSSSKQSDKMLKEKHHHGKENDGKKDPDTGHHKESYTEMCKYFSRILTISSLTDSIYHFLGLVNQSADTQSVLSLLPGPQNCPEIFNAINALDANDPKTTLLSPLIFYKAYKTYKSAPRETIALKQLLALELRKQDPAQFALDQTMANLGISKQEEDVLGKKLSRFKRSNPSQYKDCLERVRNWIQYGDTVNSWVTRCGEGVLMIWLLDISRFKTTKNVQPPALVHLFDKKLTHLVIAAMLALPHYEELKKFFRSMDHSVQGFLGGVMTAGDVSQRLCTTARKVTGDPWYEISGRIPIQDRKWYWVGNIRKMGFKHDDLRSLDLLKRGSWLDGDVIERIMRIYRSTTVPPNIFIGEEGQYGPVYGQFCDIATHENMFNELGFIRIPENAEILLLPILVHLHWVFVRVDLETEPINVEMANSMSRVNIKDEQMLEYVKRYVTVASPRGAELSSRWPSMLTEFEAPQQVGSDDCGIHVVHQIVKQLKGNLPTKDHRGAAFYNRKRHQYTRMIVDNYLGVDTRLIENEREHESKAEDEDMGKGEDDGGEDEDGDEDEDDDEGGSSKGQPPAKKMKIAKK